MSRFSRTYEKTERSRALRREMTGPERQLWSRLSRRQLGGYKFRRQHPIGPYVLDFYCSEVKLCVEVDGEQHGFASGMARDAIRTGFLESKGICVLRFWNHEIQDSIEAVLDAILEQAENLKLEQQYAAGHFPSPWKGEG